MKLLVIVVCLLSERFLIHVSSHSRFDWFTGYATSLLNKFPNQGKWSTQLLKLALILIPLVLTTSIILYLFNSWLFGFVGLLLNIFLFYYCLGPSNAFYPERTSLDEDASKQDAGEYLAKVNNQLFGVIFWYVVTGPIGLLVYRLISLSGALKSVAGISVKLTSFLDYIPAKLTSLLYLIVGNFQAGLSHFANFIFSSPKDNHLMLETCGLYALDYDQEEQSFLPKAEMLVEHAVIVLLVLLAFLTLAMWL
jgi:AmpE protein